MAILESKASLKGNLKSFLQFSYGTWVLAFISFLTTPIISWLILPEEFGKAAMFTLAYNLLINLILLGADQSFSRMFFEQKEPIGRSKLLAESLNLPVLVSLVCIVLIFANWEGLSFLLFDRQESRLIAVLLTLSLVIGIFNRLSLLLIRMQKRANAFSALQVFSGLANVAFLLFYSYFVSRDFVAIIAAFFFSTFLTTLICILTEFKVWKESAHFFFNGINREIFRYGIPFVPVFLVDWIFQGTDRFFLRYLTSFEEVGLYVASFKIVSVMNLIQTGFTLYWSPFSFEKFSQNPDDRASYSLVFNYLSLILFSFVTIILFFSQEIVLLLSSAYADIADIFPFLLLVPVLYTLSEITVVGINFKKRTSWHLWVSVFALTVNVILNFLLIPVLGVRGAAISTAIGYLGFFLVRTLLAYRLYPIQYEWPKFVSSIVLVIGISFIQSYLSPGLLTYGLTLLVFLAIQLIYYQEIRGIYRLMINFGRA